MYVVAFFKVMQQQSIGEVANPITYYDISEQIIFVCYSERIICQSYAQMKKVQFFSDSQCIITQQIKQSSINFIHNTDGGDKKYIRKRKKVQGA